jgi:hypothetical protein
MEKEEHGNKKNTPKARHGGGGSITIDNRSESFLG